MREIHKKISPEYFEAVVPRGAIRPVAQFVNELAASRALRIWVGLSAQTLKLFLKSTVNK